MPPVPFLNDLRDGKMLLIILRAGSSSYSGTFSFQYGEEQGIGRRLPSFLLEYIYIILGKKGTLKSTKKIINLVFLENTSVLGFYPDRSFLNFLSSHSFIAFSQQFCIKTCQNSPSVIQEMTRQSFLYE